MSNNNIPRNNYLLRFLILLPQTDYDKYLFFSYRDIVWYNRSRFPGLLTIEKFEEADQLPYNIEEPVLPRQLYIMLPKERMYVPSDSFTGRYISSKMRELIQIFITLRATSIKYVRYDSDEETKSMLIEFGTDFPNFSCSEGVHKKNMDSKKTGIEYEIRIDSHTNQDDPLTINMFSQPSFYYLKKEPSWKDMIIRRIEGGVTFDKYTYLNNETKLLKGGFIQQLQCMNLSVNYDWKKYKQFIVDYEVTY